VLLDNESGRTAACQFAVQLLLPVIIISLLLLFLISYLVYESWFVKPEKKNDLELLKWELEGMPFQGKDPSHKVGLNFGKKKLASGLAMSFETDGGHTIEIMDIDGLFNAFSGDTQVKISGMDDSKNVQSNMNKPNVKGDADSSDPGSVHMGRADSEFSEGVDDEEQKDRVQQLLNTMERKEKVIADSEMIYDPKFGGVQPKDSVMVDAVQMSEFDPTKGF